MSFFKPKGNGSSGPITESDLPSTVKEKLGKVNGIGNLSELKTKNKSSLTAATNELTTQLADMPKKVNGISPDETGNIQIPVPEVDTSKLATKQELQNIASGSPKGSYATLSDLETALPTGSTGTYVVAEDGKLYGWADSEWTAIVQYQSTGIPDKSVTPSKLSFLPVQGVKSNNIFNGEMQYGSLSWGGAEENQYKDVIRSGFIPVIGGQPLTYKLFGGKSNDVQYFYEYDANKVFIKLNTVYGISSSITLNENTRFVRFRNNPVTGYVNPTLDFYRNNMHIEHATEIQQYSSPGTKVKYEDIILPGDVLTRPTPYEDIVFYAGTVTQSRSSNDVLISFSKTDTRLIYRFNGTEKIITLTTLEYTVPHNSSLVINRKSNTLEVIPSNNVVSGTHIILARNHLGLLKTTNLRIENLYGNNASYFSGYRRPLNKYTFSFKIDQDATVVKDEVWAFIGGASDHSSSANIYRLDKSTLQEKSIIKHNLGHANAVDYVNDTLLVFNGGGYPPEINLYKNPYNKGELKTSDAENTQIIFKEGSKRLNGDGGACFGENERIAYYFDNSTIYKILLGMGDNDLSDKTTDKSDTTKWGTFVSGRPNTEYNGTAQITGVYRGSLSTQAQGMCYDGFLYISSGFDECHAYKIALNNDATYTVLDDYKYSFSDYKGVRMNIEAEVVYTHDSKIYVGARNTTGTTFIVEFQL